MKLKRHKFKYLWRIAHIVLSIITGAILILLLIIGLGSTSTGFKILCHFAQPLLKHEGIAFSSSEIKGTIYHFELPTLLVKNTSVSFLASNLEVEWSPWQVFVKKIQLDTLSAKSLLITTSSKKTNPESAPFKNTWQLVIHKLTIANLLYKNESEGFVQSFGRLSIRLKANRQEIYLPYLSLKGPSGSLNLTGRIGFLAHQPVMANGKWMFRLPNDIYTSGILTIDGQFNDFTASLSATVNKHYHKNLIHVSLTYLPEEIQNFKLEVLQDQHGKLTTKGNISWQKGQFKGQLQAELEKFRLHEWWPTVSAPISAHSTLHLSPENLNLNLSAHYQTQTIQTEIVANRQKLSEWSGFINQLLLTRNNITFQLNHPTPFQYNSQPFQLIFKNLCFLHERSHLCTQLNISKQSWSVKAQGEDIPLEFWLAQNANTTIKQTGHSSLAVELSKSNDHSLEGHLALSLNNFSLRPTQSDADRWLNDSALTIQTGHLTADLRGSQLESHFNIAKSTLGIASANVYMTDAFNPNSPIHGNLKVHLNNLTPLGAWSNAIYKLNGSILGEMTIQGTLAHPNLNGKLGLENGSLVLASLGLTLTNMNLAVLASPHQKAKIEGGLESGKGKIQISGNIAFRGTHPDLQLNINGKEVTFMDLPAGTIIGSPTLTYQQTSTSRSLTGNINISHAFINADQFHSSATVNPDVVLVDPDNIPLHESSELPFSSNVKIMLGQDISFQGFGIFSKIAGTLTITSAPRQAAIGNGTLRSIEGYYKGYGKQFNITEGSLNFTNSPLDNPGINVTALYQLNPTGVSNHLINKLEVGVRISGTLKNRTISLFSNPAMSQENILSYIVLGEPLDQLQQSDQSALSKAAALFVLEGGDDSVLNEIQKKLGLSQLAIGSLDNKYSSFTGIPLQASPTDSADNTTASQNNTAIFVGKALNPNLYLSYGVGLFNRQQEISLSLKLGRNWTLKSTGSSQDSGVDLIYNISKN